MSPHAPPDASRASGALPRNATITKAAQPKRNVFDPWHSSSRGHQTADNSHAARTKTSWTAVRTQKLSAQLGSGQSSRRRDRKSKNEPEKGQLSIAEALHVRSSKPNAEARPPAVKAQALEQKSEDGELGPDEVQAGKEKKKQIFANLCIYINGSTAPLIGDHKLRHLLAEHGARMAIALGRRSVTHVILGTTSKNGWAGGGLAGGKIQREVERV